MQQATYLNIAAYESLKSKNFSLKTTQKEHELLSNQMMQLWIPCVSAINEFSYIYDDGIWEQNKQGLSKMYKIQASTKPISHFLFIHLDKSPFEATRVKIQFFDRVSDFVKVNIFNTEFFQEDK
jgi:hypothetical protein